MSSKEKSPEKKDQLINELKNRVKNLTPLEDEPDFFHKDETIIRYLKAREWNLKEAEKQLLGTIEWRRKTKPLHIDCNKCHNKPGFHSMRQIGFDLSGRPIIYSSFSQSNCTKNSVEDSITHVTYLIENAKKTMSPGITTFVLIIDCSGVTIQACNPKLGYEVTNILSSHYPERLGQVFCVNHSQLFQGIWNAIKVFLHPNTANKVKLLKKSHALEKFQKLFSQETTDWLMKEMAMNKSKKITEEQRTFWLPPSVENEHDPRGCPDYVEKYFTTKFKNEDSIQVHKPHPNIVDALIGKLNKQESLQFIRNSSVNNLDYQDAANVEVDIDEWEDIDELNIPTELQIQENAHKIS